MTYLSLILVSVGHKIDDLVLRSWASNRLQALHTVLPLVNFQLVGVKLISHFLLSYIGKDLSWILLLFFLKSRISLLGPTYLDDIPRRLPLFGQVTLWLSNSANGADFLVVFEEVSCLMCRGLHDLGPVHRLQETYRLNQIHLVKLSILHGIGPCLRVSNHLFVSSIGNY